LKINFPTFLIKGMGKIFLLVDSNILQAQLKKFIFQKKSKSEFYKSIPKMSEPPKTNILAIKL
ncbi:hypothetical protein, partial [Leptospira interrogans]|uniref:hypothetical protein n=1 Tax=Leptospira interrogans TaxID=173 RepID=UPI0002BADEA3